MNRDYCQIWQLILDGKDANFLSTFLISKKEEKKEEDNIENFGIFALKEFIRLNWTGPVTENSKEKCLEFQENQRSQRALDMLTLDGEIPYPLIRFPYLLVIAKVLLINNKKWYRRALFTHQRLLDNHSETLKNEIFKLVTNYEDDSFHQAITDKTSTLEDLLETTIIYQYYKDDKNSKRLIDASCRLMGFTHELAGKLGRKTEFQTFDVAQLQVKITSLSSFPSSSMKDTNPKKEEICGNETRNNDVNTNDISLKSNDSLPLSMQKEIRLSVEQRLILLSYSWHLYNFHKDSNEELSCYLDLILNHPSCWTLYSTGLYLRSLIEVYNIHKMERAALQLQALANQINECKLKGENEQTVKELDKSSWFFQTYMPPFWTLEKIQGLIFAGLGAFKTAFELFRQHHLWNEAISCLVQCQEYTRAEELCLEHLEKEGVSNFILLCILGDLKKDHLWYEKAWSLSNGKFGRAKRALGNWYFEKYEWKKAIEAYEETLSLNSLFPKTWFLLGCALVNYSNNYQEDEDQKKNLLKKSLNAFNRSISLDDQNIEGWNNMAAVHFKLGNVFYALECWKQSTKLDRDNQLIWENILTTAIIHNLTKDTILALNRLLEIKKDKLELLDLKKILFNDSSDRKMFEQFLEKAIEILHSREDFWLLFADYYDEKGDIDREKCEFALWKAFNLIIDQEKRNEIYKRIQSMKVSIK